MTEREEAEKTLEALGFAGCKRRATWPTCRDCKTTGSLWHYYDTPSTAPDGSDAKCVGTKCATPGCNFAFWLDGSARE